MTGRTDIDSIAIRARQLLATSEAGRIGKDDAKKVRELLETVLRARQLTDVQAQLAAIDGMLEDLTEAQGA